MVGIFALVGLGVWYVVNLLKEEITAPPWFFLVLTIGLSALGLWWAGENPLWAPAVAGFALGWQRLDEIVVFIRDWIKLAPLRGQPRR
jgi:hypothetical protein